MDLQKQLAENKEDQELNVGITQYLNPGKPILGITKFRISDFIVNEIDQFTKKPIFFEKGSLQKQFDEADKLTQQKKEEDKLEKQVEKKIQDEDAALAVELFGQENKEALDKFYEDLNSGEKKSFFDLTIEGSEDKEQRKKIHEFVREKLPFFDSRAQDGKIVLKYMKNQVKKQKFTTKHSEKKQIKTISFIMQKTNVDTNTAIGQIAGYLKYPSKMFGQAGIKDKRGCTTQKITICNLKFPVEQLIKRLYHYKSENISFCDVKETQKQLRIGDLYGNRFSIALRLIEEDKEAIKENVENLAKEGFINYFGMQRFGNNNTHEVGKYILRKEYSEAVEKILFSQNSRFQEALDQYKEDRDADKALSALPTFMKIERSLIAAQNKFGENDGYNCLISLQKSVRDLYPHAYQSYIWNKLASLRVNKFGKNVVVGDIVAKDQSILEQLNNEEDDGQEDNKYSGIKDIQYEYVTEENISKYTLKDVLIPIVGGESDLIDFEKFNLGKEMKAMLDEDDLSISQMKDQRNFFVTGGFRTLLFTAEDVEYKFLRFNDKATDFMTPFYNTENDIDVEDGKYSALVARFTLKKGCYATMMMRELTKVSSAINIQRQLNDAFDKLGNEEKQEQEQEGKQQDQQEDKIEVEQQ